MRRARRTDSNQRQIVDALRAAGRFVEVLSDVGRGVPDLLVAFQGRWLLLEVKRPGADLTDDERDWHAIASRRAPVHVVHTIEEAIAATLPPGH